MNVTPRQPREPKLKRTAATGSTDHSSDFPPRVVLAIVALALAVGFVLRTLDLRADPPPDLSLSSAVYSDEAHNAYSARNWALYGRWQVDEYPPYVVYPWLNLFTGLVFRVAGVGFVQLKIVSLLAGLLLVLAMYFVGRSVNRRAGTIAAVVTASSYELVMYSRLGLVEGTQVLLVAATIAFLARANTSRAAAILSGACALFAVLFVKVSAVFLLPATLLLLVYEIVRTRRERVQPSAVLSQALFCLLGALVPLAVWLAIIFIPHRETYLTYIANVSAGAKGGHPYDLRVYLFNAFSVGAFSKLYDRLPVVAALGFAALPALVGRAGRTAVFSALILVTGVAMLGYGLYHPDRYELFTLVPLIGGFAIAVDRLVEKEVLIGHPWPRLPGALLYGLWLWPLAAQITFRLAHARYGNDGATVTALVAGLAGSFGLWRLHMITRGGIPLRSRLLRIGIAAALFLLVLGGDVKLYTNWYRVRTHVMYECSRDLDRALPDSSVTGGFWAPALLSTSHKRALFMTDLWGPVNLSDPIGRFGLTHLVVTGEREFALFDSVTNGRLSTAKAIRLYRINDVVLVGVAELRPWRPDTARATDTTAVTRP